MVITWAAGEKDVAIMVTDSRPGLVNPSNAFVPFYTTKPQGSGIGLILPAKSVKRMAVPLNRRTPACAQDV